jgi:hypothetical protein
MASPGDRSHRSGARIAATTYASVAALSPPERKQWDRQVQRNLEEQQQWEADALAALMPLSHDEHGSARDVRQYV